jgi:hypothetical protein
MGNFSVVRQLAFFAMDRVLLSAAASFLRSASSFRQHFHAPSSHTIIKTVADGVIP